MKRLFLLLCLLAAPAAASELDGYIYPGDPSVISEIFRLGKARGNLPGRISRLGDSISANGGFFLSEAAFEKFAVQALGDRAGLFRENFGRRPCEGRPNAAAVAKGTENGCAAYSGKTLGWLLAAPAGSAAPADMELAEYRPAYAVILIGTNDLGYPGTVIPPAELEKKLAAYKDGFRELARRVAAAGTVPILTTLPPRTADLWPQLAFTGAKYAPLIAAVNGWLKSFASEQGYPLIDFHSALCRGADPSAALDACLLGGDGVHPGREGYDLRNRLTLLALARVSAAADRGRPVKK